MTLGRDSCYRHMCEIPFETHDRNSLAEANFASRYLDAGKGQTCAQMTASAEHAWHVRSCKHMEDQVREGPLGPVPKPLRQGEAQPHTTTEGA